LNASDFKTLAIDRGAQARELVSAVAQCDPRSTKGGCALTSEVLILAKPRGRSVQMERRFERDAGMVGYSLAVVWKAGTSPLEGWSARVVWLERAIQPTFAASGANLTRTWLWPATPRRTWRTE